MILRVNLSVCLSVWVFSFAGKALFDGQHLNAYFCRSFYKHMLGRRCVTADAESIDPTLYNNLQKMLHYSLEDLGLELTFRYQSSSSRQPLLEHEGASVSCLAITSPTLHCLLSSNSTCLLDRS